MHRADAQRQVLSVETSTAKAPAFVEAFLGSPALVHAEYSLTSREVRTIVDGESLTGRAAACAILLATGVIEDNPVAIVVAATSSAKSVCAADLV